MPCSVKSFVCLCTDRDIQKDTAQIHQLALTVQIAELSVVTHSKTSETPTSNDEHQSKFDTVCYDPKELDLNVTAYLSY